MMLLHFIRNLAELIEEWSQLRLYLGRPELDITVELMFTFCRAWRNHCRGDPTTGLEAVGVIDHD